jgi:hypothetical protein
MPVKSLSSGRESSNSDLQYALRERAEQALKQSPKTSTTSLSSIEKPKRRFPTSNSWWLAEISAVIIAFASLASVIGDLKAYPHTIAVSDIGHGITLNGLIATLSTIVRIALLVIISSGLSQCKWIWFSSKGKVWRRSYRRRKLKDTEMFDDASRGAIGSLRLLWALK